MRITPGPTPGTPEKRLSSQALPATSATLNQPPVRLGISIGDSIAALYGVIGALLALQHRHASGCGQLVDVAPVVVKVIDILGNDTTRAIEIEVK